MLASSLRLLGPKFDVLEVPSAEEGILLALRDAVDLLVVDVHLPGISGLELVQRIRVRNPQLKIILITGVEDSIIRQQVMEARVNAYFFKPIVLEEFINKVLDCLGVVQEDQVHARKVEAAPVVSDVAEGLVERLYTLRVDLKAYAAIILDRTGQVCAKSGEYPPLYEEPAALLSLIEAWDASERFSTSLAIKQSDSMLCIRSRHYHLILTHAGKPYMLVIVISGPRFRDGWEHVLRRAQEDLLCILSANGMLEVVEDTEVEARLDEMNAQATESDLVDVENLLRQLGHIEIGDDVDAFWDQVLEGDSFSGVENGAVISYDQASKLGLIPQGEEGH